MKVWTQHQIDCLNVMGVTQWKSKQVIKGQKKAKSVDPLLLNDAKHKQQIAKIPALANKGSVKNTTPAPLAETVLYNDVSQQSETASWQQVANNISHCKACSRFEKRQQAIVGNGNKNTNLLIITDAPTETDDVAGEMYSGEVGKLFSKMLNAININLERVYITPFVKCFQANSLSAQKDEFEQCQNHLQQQINLIKPHLILIFSENAAQMILKNQSPINALRQQVHLSLNQIKTIVTYSPSLILTDASKKRAIWEDLKFVKTTLIEHAIDV